ncbi:MAG TPA: SMP-30/gluconolactonase/LRE family protein [Spongiibacteraceae bacterium]|nr:SMP-30/gluconolactonase/LRE family protein [Spongiibacteraceae bacterium]
MSRYSSSLPTNLAEGWTLERLTAPSRLFGANGLRTGADGRIYVAQVSGSQVSAIDVNSGAIETVSPKGGDIVAPDDLVFDPQGNLYVTEISEGRVGMRDTKGNYRVVYGDIPCANPITFYQGRLFAGECRPGGRIMELDLNGGPARVIAENLMMPNAMEVGPDGMLYFPQMVTNEICRVSLDGGPVERVAGDLGVPDAVKFDAKGFIVSTQVASGQVLRIDPRTGEKTILAQLAPGLDNLTFVGERLFVSNIAGQVDEVLADGKVKSVVPDSFNFPLGLAVDENGGLYIADGGFTYSLHNGKRQALGMFFTPGYPGYVRGIVTAGAGEVVVTTAAGQVARWRPAQQKHEILAEGFDRPYGVALTASGAAIFADAGTGRVLSIQSSGVEVLASDLKEPKGVAITADGTCLVGEEGAGRIVKLGRGGVETVLDGLKKPQGLFVRGDLLYIVDAGSRELIEYNLSSNKRRTIASGLPVGAPEGMTPKPINPFPPLSGAIGPFAGIAAGADGTLYISADAEGSILAVRPH